MHPYKYIIFSLHFILYTSVMGQTKHDVVSETVGNGWFKLAQSQQEQAQYDKATGYYQKAIEHFDSVLDSSNINSTIEKIYWKTHINLANTLTKTGKITQAIELLKKSEANVRRKSDLHTLFLGDIYYNLGEARQKKGEFEEALNNYGIAARLYKTQGQTESFVKSHTMIGTIYQNLGHFNDAMQQYDLAATTLRETYSENHPFFSIIYNNMGVVHAKLASHKQALSYFKKTQQIDEQRATNNELELAGIYHNLGALYYLENDDERALEYLSRALRLNSNQLGEQDASIAKLYSDIGLVYKEKKEYTEALSYFQRALHIYSKQSDTPNQAMAEAYHNIGTLYSEQGNYELALRILNKTLEINNQLFSESTFKRGKLYNDIGNVYFQQKDYQTSISYYIQATPIIKKYVGKHHPEVVDNYTHLGKAYAAQGATIEALDYYQKAIHSAVPSFFAINTFVNPTLVEDSIHLKYNLLNTLHQKAKTLYQLYLSEKEADYLHYAYETNQFLVGLLDIIRTNAETEGAREKLIHRITGFYEFAVKVDFELYNERNDIKYLEDALTIMEKSKSTLLLEGIRDSEAKRYGGVPKATLEEEEEARVQLAFYKDRLQRVLNGEATQDTTQESFLQNKILQYRGKQDSILAHLEENYSKYYDYKYQSPNVELDKVQEYLADNELIIEYMWGKNTLYTIGITKSKIEQHQQAIDSTLIKTIERYQASFEEYQSNPEVNDETLNQRFANFKRDASYLYQQLVFPISRKLPMTSIHKLTIIPDNYLGYISFETLLSSPSDAISYRALPYLIRKYTVRYDYSTELLMLADKKRELGRWVYMGFAPEYPPANFAINTTNTDTSTTRDVVTPLKNNQPEVRDIRWQVGGHQVLGRAATEASFKKRAEDYRILHLAMHAFADDNDPKRSRLVFAEGDSLEDNNLHVYELYNMRLKAELAVLSACDTGNGKARPGEGVISLARAFKFAGCANIVMSLWKANDLTTKDIMVDFYKHLHDGKKKSTALRAAKLNYLDDENRLKNLHPSYWATFVLIGSDEPVEIGVPFRGRYVLYGVGLIFFLAFFIFWESRAVNMMLDIARS